MFGILFVFQWLPRAGGGGVDIVLPGRVWHLRQRGSVVRAPQDEGWPRSDETTAQPGGGEIKGGEGGGGLRGGSMIIMREYDYHTMHGRGP